MHYIDIGRTIATHRQAGTYHLRVTSQRVPETDLLWPPGYPFLLSICMRLGCDSKSAAFLISALSYTAVVVLLLMVLRRREWVLVGVVVWLWLIWNTEVVRYAWSEGPFIALVLGAVTSWGFALGGGWSRLLAMTALAGVLAAGAALTRYVGVSVIPTFLLGGVVLGVVFRRDRAMCLRVVVGAGGAAVVASSIMLLWMWRNHILNGSLLGPDRPPTDTSVRELLWALALSANRCLIVALPVLIGLVTAQRTHVPALRTREESTRGACLWSCVALLSTWIMVYLALLLWQESTVKIDGLGSRLLFPACGAALLVGLLALEARCHLAPDQLRRLLLLGCLVAPLLLLPGARVLRTPETPAVPAYEWVRQNTPQGALLIGQGVWGFRYATGRPVLESGSYYEGEQTLKGSEVVAFLRRHGHRFPRIYLVVSESDCAAVKASYRAAGITLESVCGGSLPHDTQPAVRLRILQVKSWAASGPPRPGASPQPPN